jgi:hypothetical protein
VADSGTRGAATEHHAEYKPAHRNSETNTHQQQHPQRHGVEGRLSPTPAVSLPVDCLLPPPGPELP